MPSEDPNTLGEKPVSIPRPGILCLRRAWHAEALESAATVHPERLGLLGREVRRIGAALARSDSRMDLHHQAALIEPDGVRDIRKALVEEWRPRR